MDVSCYIVQRLATRTGSVFLVFSS